jgi:hypothetical protein
MDAMDTEWVEVRSTTWLHEAELVRSVLASAGIEAEIPNEHTLGVQPLYAQALGGVRVLVRRADFDRAMEVLTTDARASD